MTALLARLGVAASLFWSFYLTTSPARGQEFDQTVARISFVSGGVSYSRGDDPGDWDPAIVNVPFTLGDRIYAPEDGRAELQLPAGNFIRLAPRSYFSALNLTYDTKQFYLGEGSASFNIRNLGSDETFEVATPNMAVTFDTPGKYRIEVDEDGNSRVLVRRGRVIVAANGRQISVEEGELRVYGIDSPRYEIVALRGPDRFDRWADERDERFERAYSRTHQYASDQYIGIEELGEHGRWEQIPEYGYAWTPDRVPAGWQPYTVGHWFWQDPWGWTWVSREPWGWAPSHYGRWTNYRSRWYWVPVRQRVRVVRYEPACVEFVRVRDRVGWFPLHPRDRSIPWWRRRVAPQNVTYVNRQHVTIVNQNIFVSGRNVTNNIVRDPVVAREANAVRVMEQPLPVPTRSSLRVRADRGGERSHRPPANVLSRPAVVRVAPAPPPPTFEEKLPEIQKSRGEPVAPDKAVAMGLKNLKTRNRHNPIRPAAVETSRADFAPRNPSASAPAPQPVTPSRGKKLATAEEPVLTNLPRRPERAQKSEAQTEQTRPLPAEPLQRRVPPQSQPSKQEQERELQKRERQPQEQRREEHQQPRNEKQREELKRRELERQQHEQERQQQQKQLREQPREEQQQFRQERLREEQKRQDLERQRLEAQGRQKDKQLREHKEQQTRKQQLEEQKRQELQRQQQERPQQQQLEEQKRQDLSRQRQPEQPQEHQQFRKERQQQQLRAAQQREEQKRQEQHRQIEQKQAQEQQRKAQQLRKEQKREELEGKVPQRPGTLTP